MKEVTYEEMAEESLISYRKEPKWEGKIFMQDENTSYKDGFLAGLEAGKPKWHKVTDGDYPPCKEDNYTINVLTDRGDIAYYNYDLDYWVAEPSSAEIDPPISWCEIPKYEE